MSFYSLDDSGISSDENPFASAMSKDLSNESQIIIDYGTNDPNDSSIIFNNENDKKIEIIPDQESESKDPEQNLSNTQIDVTNDANETNLTKENINYDNLSVEEKLIQVKQDFLKELTTMKEEGNKLFRESQFESAINTYERCFNICNAYFKGMKQLIEENPIIKDSFESVEIDKLKDNFQWFSLQDIELTNQDAISTFSEKQVASLEKAIQLAKIEVEEINEFRLFLILNSAMSHIKLKQYQNGIKACNLALELDPKSTKAYLRRSKCYEGIGNYDLARKDLEKVKELDPSVGVNALKSFENSLIAEKKKERASYKGILRGASRENIAESTSPSKPTQVESPQKPNVSQSQSKSSTFGKIGVTVVVGIGVLASFAISYGIFKRFIKRKQ